MNVNLPGGLPNNGGIERHAKFHPLNGRIEQALIEVDQSLDRPEYVTAILSSTLASIGSLSADKQHVSDLCIADRQYLMLRLAAMLNGEQMWLKVSCNFCEELFDVDVRRCDLPVKSAGENFPFVTLKIKDWTIAARVPTGKDQGDISSLSDEDAMQLLLQLCVDSVNDELPDEFFFSRLNESDIEAIDEALDSASPAVCDQLLVTCPECDCSQRAELDHYTLSGINERLFYDEIHTLATHYHWSEEAILNLPRERRRLYLSLINRSAGMTE